MRSLVVAVRRGRVGLIGVLAVESLRLLSSMSCKRINWCPGWESNPHEEKSPEDFKSSASAIPPPGRWHHKSSGEKHILQHYCIYFLTSELLTWLVGNLSAFCFKEARVFLSLPIRKADNLRFAPQ